MAETRNCLTVFRGTSVADLPVLAARGRTLPEAWQNAMLVLAEHGTRIPTSFDRSGDPESFDATIIFVADEPISEPRIHIKAIPAGIEDLEVYRLEVIYGIHNHWVNRGGVEWNYTYHERIRSYEMPGLPPFDQWAALIDKLANEQFLFRRRFQLTTWIPQVDLEIEDPPCLQRIWLRFLPDPTAKEWVLNVNSNWRSRDAYKASFMNIYALTDWMRVFAQEVAERKGVKIRLGRYMDISDSLHVYGKDLEGVGSFQSFLNTIKSKTIEELTWRTDDPQIRDWIIESRRKTQARLDFEAKGAGKNYLDPNQDYTHYPYPSEWDK